MKLSNAFLIAGCIFSCAALGQIVLGEQAGTSDMRDVLVLLRAGADEDDLDAVLKVFREIGGKPNHIFPPSVFIGRVVRLFKGRSLPLKACSSPLSMRQ
ncbi:MAG TPA: hypothetical protein EYP53_03330 [Candidatus Latescibacteria bacterium]|nr:hypothetical protein [Candidatus Latescibacterota bacterium]